ncbi:MAG: SDR family oxidoreductase [Gammaproteobacteria bacterium]|nr:SDR family oxidoreductase [Gammaproteobacteria bacterium]
MPEDLATKTALVTGASSGIGLAISRSLLAAGCRVIGIARDFSKLDPTSDRFETHSQDLVDLEQSAQLIKSITGQRQIDYFIHSAGAGLFGSIEQFSLSQIDSFLKANLTSALVICRQLIPGMRQRKHGRIIFIGSESALQAGKKGALYSSAKFGMRGLAQALREDCSRDGIAVSLINPGMVDTAFFAEQDFRPGPHPSNSINSQDVADLVMHIIRSNPDMVIDEINLSPRNKSIDFS